MFRTKNLNTS